jgi:HEAT repeat protein
MIAYDPTPLRMKLLSWTEATRKTRFGWLIPNSLATDRRFASAELAVHGFQLLGPTASPAIPELESLATPPHSPAAASRAILALQAIGEPALPALGRLSLDPRTRSEAMLAIVQLGSTGVQVDPLLNRFLQDADQDSWLVLYGLRNFPVDRALPTLTNALLSPKPRVRQYAAETIARLGKDGRCAIPVLIQTAQDTNAEVRAKAIETLSILAPEMFVTNTTPTTSHP